jgi:hypothetical protein
MARRLVPLPASGVEPKVTLRIVVLDMSSLVPLAVF